MAMAGTNHRNRTETTGAAPVFILVAPQMGENIGAAARAMWNFGLDRMRLVAPRDGWPNPRAEAMASGAARVLDRVGLFEDTRAACADLTHVFATTARDRSLAKTVMTPERAMAEARDMIAAGERVGVLFGPERSGLETADVVRANTVISVPVNPAFGSLNLAQCALLLAYEWRKVTDATPPEAEIMGKAVRAEGREVDAFLKRLFERLDRAGFFYPDEKRDSMTANLENLFRRAPLTDADVRTLHGVMRALAEGRRGE